MNMNDFVLTSRDLSAIWRWLFWGAAISVGMRSLAKAFGPLVLAYSPKVYRFLALFGSAALTLIADAQAFADTMRPAHDPPKPPTIPPAGLAVLLALSIVGCAGVPAPGGTTGVPGWVVTVSVTIHAARAADVAIRDFVRNDTVIAPVERENVARLLDIVDASLTAANGSLAVYETDRSATAQCRLHADISAVITNLLQVNSILVAASVPVPPVVPIVLGGLGSIADAVAPSCPTPVQAEYRRVMTNLTGSEIE